MNFGLRIFLGMAVLVLLAGLAGCGDGNDDAITKAEFMKRADVICEENAKVRSDAAVELLKEHKQGPPPEKVEELVIEVALPAIQEELDLLSALPVPEGEAERIDAILAALEKGIGKIEANPEKTTERSLEWFREFETLAVNYGFDECGNI